MKIEIWSDVMCPFCYIGKRRFEAALEQFAHRDEVEVEWKSFQLNPDLDHVPGRTVNGYLAEAKGISLERAQEMNRYVAEMASESGLSFQLDKAVVVNTFRAHRFATLAARHGLQDAAEERLFKAYFEEGLNLADLDTLARLGEEIGLDGQAVRQALASDQFAYEVKQDILEARNLGITGVPFFVIDRKYAVSGAQQPALFLQAMNQAWQEAKGIVPVGAPGESCGVDGCC